MVLLVIMKTIVSESHYLHTEECRRHTWTPVGHVTSRWTFRIRLLVTKMLLEDMMQQVPSGKLIQSQCPQASTTG